MGTDTNMSPEKVKSICHGLEVSPSKSTRSSPIYHGGSKAHGKGAAGTSSKLASGYKKRGH